MAKKFGELLIEKRSIDYVPIADGTLFDQ